MTETVAQVTDARWYLPAAMWIAAPGVLMWLRYRNNPKDPR